ncbi:MAG: c-type cytochrome [Pseudomonadota bacterium]
MPTMSTTLLPGLGVTGLVLAGAVAFATVNRDRQELDVAQSAIDAAHQQRAALEARVNELEAAHVDRDTLEARIAELEAALDDALSVEPEPAEAPDPTPDTAVLAVAGTGDIENGKALFDQCASCHEVGAGAGNSVGPHLNLLFGRKAAGIDGFRYSDSLVRAASNGLEWHADTLSAYIEDPRTFASGTRMSYAGMKDAGERRDLLAYLRVFSDNPSDIPEADPTAVGTDHAVDPDILALQGDPEYGEYLSSECKTCHQTSGGDDGIPSIVLWPEEAFVTAMHAYKDKARPNPVMQMIAGRLNDEEIAALAAYFKDLDE